MEHKNYIGLVHKSITGQLSDSEKASYDEWLEQPESKEANQDITDMWNLSAEYTPTSFKPNAAKAFDKFKEAIKADQTEIVAPVAQRARIVSINPFYKFARIAAVISVFAVALFLFNNKTNDFDTHLQTASVIENSVLDDGTEIWLDKNSSLLVADGFGNNERVVKLEGKAYFNVKRDEAKPFIVHMGDNRLEVLGTSFNIDNSGENTVVEVESGVVKVNTKTAEEVLKVGDVATLNYKEDKIEVSRIKEQNFNWYQSQMNINAVSITEAMKQIGSHFGVNISLSANVDKACKLTSPLMQNVSLDEVFAVLKETHNLKYQKIGVNKFEIRFLDCQ